MDSISKKEILNLDLEQCKRFSQICALLALPFIGVRGNFEFWERNKRQKYLGDVLSTIDYIVFTNTCAANAADYATNAAADYANVATDYADAATAAAAAADYAAAAANAAADYANVNATDYAACATAAATAAAAAAAAYATEDYATNVAIFQWDTYSKFRKYLIKLFTSIRDNMPLPEFNAHEFYGGIYDNFLKALKDVGCEYWANIYEHVYSNNFEFDEVELRLRLQAPDSVREEGAAAIAKHMLAIKEQGNKETKEARIILIGSKGAGKTSLSRKLRNAYFPLPGKGKSTAGVDTFKLKLFPKEVTHLWDFGGHVIIQAAHKCFMSAECLYVLVMYGRTQRQEIDDYREWLVTVQTYSGGNARVFIVLNEFDKHSFDMPEEELKKEFGELIEGFYSFNFKKDRVKLRKLKDDIRSYIEKNFSRELPIKYFSIKQEIEQQFRKNKRELLTKKDVENIALACGLKGDYEDALKYLNILGVALSYDDIPELVLNPSWISNGVYTIINYMQKVRNSQIYFDKIPTLFIGKNSKRYGFKNCKYLYDLMVEYKLAFPVEGDTNTLLVPAALPDTKPSGIPEPLQGEKTLRRRYCFKTALPEDIFPKYIQMNHDNIKYVRRNDKTDYIVWCSGMSLVWENTNAMIYKESREVEIIVWGENKGDFLLKLNNRFHDLLSESDLKWEREEIKLPRGYYETDVIRELYQKDETIELGGEKINKAIKEYNLSLINLNVNLKAGFNPEVSINALNKTKNSG